MFKYNVRNSHTVGQTAQSAFAECTYNLQIVYLLCIQSADCTISNIVRNIYIFSISHNFTSTNIEYICRFSGSDDTSKTTCEHRDVDEGNA